MTPSLFWMLFYHSEKLQSTKTEIKRIEARVSFYHSEKLQSTKTATGAPV